MKVQLNEQTLNAYINEAIRQELEEANIFTKGAKAVGTGLKKAGKGTKNYFKALGGNKKAINKGTKLQGELDDELKAVRKAQDKNIADQAANRAEQGGVEAWDMNKKGALLDRERQLGAEGDRLTQRRTALTNRLHDVETSLNKAKAGRTLARTATGAAAAAGAGGYLLGNAHGKKVGGGNNSPDTPWNDGIDSSEAEVGGWDGNFPWDETNPQWTPRNPKPSTPAPTAPAQNEPEPSTPTAPAQSESEPAQPVRPELGSLTPVTTNFNMPTGVTSNTEPAIQRRYAPGTDPNNVNKWNNTANFRRLSGQIERGAAPEKAAKTLQNRRERQEKRYDRISAQNGGQNQSAAQ